MKYETMQDKCGGCIVSIGPYKVGKNFVVWNVENEKDESFSFKVKLQIISREEALNVLGIPVDTNLQDYEIESKLHQLHIGVFLKSHDFSYDENVQEEEDYSDQFSAFDMLKIRRISELNEESNRLNAKILELYESIDRKIL